MVYLSCPVAAAMSAAYAGQRLVMIAETKHRHQQGEEAKGSTRPTLHHYHTPTHLQSVLKLGDGAVHLVVSVLTLNVVDDRVGHALRDARCD